MNRIAPVGCRVGSKAIDTGPKRTFEDPLGIFLERSSFRVSLDGSLASFRSSPIVRLMGVSS